MLRLVGYWIQIPTLQNTAPRAQALTFFGVVPVGYRRIMVKIVTIVNDG